MVLPYYFIELYYAFCIKLKQCCNGDVENWDKLLEHFRHLKNLNLIQLETCNVLKI